MCGEVYGLAVWNEAVYVVSYGPPVGRRYGGGSKVDDDKNLAVSTND